MTEADELRARVAELEYELEKQKRISEVLIRRVERTIDDAGNAFALFERNTALEHDMKARTVELERANSELTAANFAKSDFLANMSHELRTPLNAIMGMTSLMLNASPTAEQREYLGIVRISADALLSQIDDVLDFARLEAGRLELNPAPIDLCIAIEEVVDTLSVRAAEAELELVCYFAPDAPRYVVADPGRLRQVLMNLLGNALKFTDTGWVEVRATGREVDGRAHVELVVEDSGVGIEAAALSRIFDKFQQVDTSITRRHSGTGLGLAITRQLVELMGGTIDVESEVGRGSTFTVRLDLRRAPDHPPVPRPALVVTEARLLVGASGTRAGLALLRQLQDWNLRVEAVTLEEVGARVDAASSKERAPYRMVFLDEPPNGFDVRLLNRVLRSGARLCLVARRGRASGVQYPHADAVVWKPQRQGDLLQALEQIGRDSSDVFPPEPDRRTVPNVLVVEDNDVNQHVAERILERCGCQVQIAANGRAAVDAAGIQTFDLVLMDLHMPIVDGFEAARAIRAQEVDHDRARVPIVAMTANVMSGIEVRCLEAGMDAYVSKPVRLDTIRALLERWVERRLLGDSWV